MFDPNNNREINRYDKSCVVTLVVLDSKDTQCLSK